MGAILNDGDNVDDQGDYGFTGSSFKNFLAIIYEYSKNKFLNMQLETLRPQRNIENNDKKYGERYQINVIDDKESDERDHISENKEETLNADIELLKLRNSSSKKK